jgi:hypothetical protein
LKKEARAQKDRVKYETLGGFIEHKYESSALGHQKRGKQTITLLKGNFEHLYERLLGKITAWDIQK